MFNSIKKKIRNFLGCQEIDIAILKLEIEQKLTRELALSLESSTKTAALEAYECKINRYWIQDMPDNAPLVKKLIKQDVSYFINEIIHERMAEYKSEEFLDKVIERIRNKQIN